MLVGDPEWETDGVVVSVDLTEQSIETAMKRGHRLIVNHHPCIFPKGKGLSRVVAGQKSGISSLVFEALRQGIAVAAYHTNFDQCSLEVVQAVSKGLGLQPKGRLLDAGEGSLLKLVVFVPSTHAQAVRDALGQAGAGHIGQYDFCTFSTQGEGTFRGSDQARPFIANRASWKKSKKSGWRRFFRAVSRSPCCLPCGLPILMRKWPLICILLNRVLLH